MAKRVHQLAKELGVKSTAVVAKCQAEGLDIKNHMSTLSAGLEATIVEWFSSEGVSTAVETAAKVDLKRVRAAKPRQRKKTVAKKTAGKSAGTATIEAPAEEETEAGAIAEPAVVVTPVELAGVDVAPGVPKRKSPREIAAEVVEADVQESAPVEPGEADVAAAMSEPASEAEGDSGAEVVAASAEVVAKPEKGAKKVKAKPAEPVRPKPELHVPTPAKLKGPRVVRVEEAEVIPDYRSRRSSGARVAPAPADDPAGSGGRGSKVAAAGTETSPARRGSRRRSLDGVDGGEKTKRRARPKARRDEKSDGLDVATAYGRGDRDFQERQARLAAASGSQLHSKERRLARDEKGGGGGGTAVAPRRIEKAVVKAPITVRDLSGAIGVRASDIIGKLMQMGVMAGINQVIQAEEAEVIALENGVELQVERQKLLLDELGEEFDREVPADELKPRPPVVAFLGHVDHGKTSLLDYIRKSVVVEGEAGGITQHMGAYLYDDGKRRVTFLDTPGHKAFTEMRARGANMTDIVVLVVAADDGVMPQTEEAINHAQAAGVQILVALNKIDLPNANEDRILGQLAEKGLTPTAWGGETEVVRTSATTGEGVDELIEHLDYVTELHQLQARTDGAATGWVVEAEMTVGEGVLARLLMKSGTLKPGDVVVSGGSYGRVRKMVSASGEVLESAGPATPIEISGLDAVPTAGERFYVAESIGWAKTAAEEQRSQRREVSLGRRRQVTLENLFSEIAAGAIKELNVVVKADFQGSVDVLTNTLTEMNTEEVAVRVLHAAVGGISESDVVLAQASNAIVIGFQVVADDRARSLAESEGVEIRLYRVIYEISDDIKKALEGMLAPRVEERKLGQAEVRQLFSISRLGVIAGCQAIDGVINRSAKVRLIRDSVVVRDGIAIESLRRVKDDVSEVRNGFECGIKLVGFNDLKTGDIIEAYELVEVTRTLD